MGFVDWFEIQNKNLEIRRNHFVPFVLEHNEYVFKGLLVNVLKNKTKKKPHTQKKKTKNKNKKTTTGNFKMDA